MNRNQFLLTTQTWKNEIISNNIGPFNLFLGDGYAYNTRTHSNTEIHILGDLYDWENPEYDNAEILENIIKHAELEIDDLISCIDKYSGHYVIIIKKGENIFLLNDTCSQREVYYNKKFSSFGTQVKLLGNVCELVEHTDIGAQKFYQSKCFEKNKSHAGRKTHKKNINHLLPNYLVDIGEKKIRRILLPEIKEINSLDYVAKKASMMLKGYIEAISNRKNLLIGLTAGYDSRILFLASLHIKRCKYYTNKMTDIGVGDDHYDISIAHKLASVYNRELTIVEKKWNKIRFSSQVSEQEYVDSLDFPRFVDVGTETNDNEIIVNGNISEIARNYYGYYKRITGRKLNFLIGYPNLNFTLSQYNDWIMEQKGGNNSGYNILDMFYWEEKMGNLQAKAKTELFALGRDIVTPYNSRKLITLLLSSKRINRDSHNNKLYKRIIAELSNHNNEIEKIPFNPCPKTRIILLLKHLKLYNIYREVMLKITFVRTKNVL
jgi:hypothetical protein